jgi:hypothetical protein
VSGSFLPSQILPPGTPVVDENGVMTKDWWLFFYNLYLNTLGSASASGAYSNNDLALLQMETDTEIAGTDQAVTQQLVNDTQLDAWSNVELPEPSLQDLADVQALSWAWLDQDPVTVSGASNGSGANAYQTLAYAATITPIVNAAIVRYAITATGNLTIAAPVSTGDNNTAYLRILSSGGAWTLTMSAYQLPSAGIVVTWPYTMTSGKEYDVIIQYSALRSQWQIVQFFGAY